MTLRLEHVCDFVVELSSPREIGECGPGNKRIIPIIGGTVSGPLLQGRILNIGADWQTILKSGVAELDARYAIETDDGAIIEVDSRGIRDASPDVTERIAAGENVQVSEYYMRTAIRLESGHTTYDWVNRALFVASGGKAGSTVRLAVHRVC